MDIEQSVVLISGASSGIGRATAAELARRGAQVLVHGRDPRRTHEVADLVGGTPLALDLLDDDGPQTLAEAALSVYGRVDALVASAGAGWSGPAVEMAPADVRTLLRLDLGAVVELSLALLPSMLARGRGAVCLVGSIAGRTGVAGEAVYAAAKAGLDGFADSLRSELSGTGVRVCSVVPGVVDTPFFTGRGRPYDRGFPRPVGPELVARRLVNGLATGRDQVYVPGWLRVPVAVKALSPGVFGRLSARFGEPVRSTAGGTGPRRRTA